MIDVQNGRGFQDMSKQRGCRTGNLLVPSPANRRYSFGAVTLLDPAELPGHEV